MLLVAEGITCGGALKTDGSTDIARISDFYILTVVGVHLQQSAQTLLRVLVCIINGSTCLDRSRIYTYEAKLTYVRVGHNLECESCEWLFI